MNENLANDNTQKQDFIQEELQKNFSDITTNTDLEKSESSNEPTTTSEPTVNCLALTVQKDYKLSIAKNIFFKSIRSTFKVAFSVFALNLLKLFL